MTRSVFTCPCCGATSGHPDDIAHGYCSRCNWWTGDPQLGPPHLAEACPERKAAEVTGLRPFAPDWTLRPGVLLREAIAGHEMSAEGFAGRSGLPLAAVLGVLSGEVRVDAVIAAGAARALGTSEAMWLNAQALYDEGLARGAKDISGDYGKEDGDMGEIDAAARAAGYEVRALVRMTHRGEALLELEGEDEVVRWPADAVAGGAGVAVSELPGLAVVVTVRESPGEGRVLSGFRLP